MAQMARPAALRLLSRRDYTTSELRAKLLAHEYAADDVESVIRNLTDQGLLDDRRTAAAYVRLASVVKGRGRLRIQRELEARGVDRALARELVGALQASDETSAIERFLQRKRVSSRLSLADRRRVYQQLLRRGFPAEAIERALKGHKDRE
jgi:regulatory protein